jgi:hypothetical protein
MTGERVEFAQCDAAPLEVGGHVLVRSTVAVWDVMTVLPAEVPPLDGVLALDAFADRPFTLSLAARTLTLESTRSLERRIAGMTRLRSRIATGLSGGDLTVFIRGALGEPGWFLLDSGNLDSTIVAHHMLPPRGGAASGVESAPLSLEGLPARDVPVRVRDIVYDGVLAEGYLRQWTWTFRLATGDVWATPAP